MSPLIAAGIYLPVALLCAGLAVRSALREEPGERDLLEGADRAVLALAATVAGALWLPLLAVLARGWLRHRLPGRLAAARRRLFPPASPAPPVPPPPAANPAVVHARPLPVAGGTE